MALIFEADRYDSPPLPGDAVAAAASLKVTTVPRPHGGCCRDGDSGGDDGGGGDGRLEQPSTFFRRGSCYRTGDGGGSFCGLPPPRPPL